MTQADQLARAIHSAKRDGDPAQLVTAVGYWNFLGLSAHADGQQVTCRLPFREDFIGNPLGRSIHGGIVYSLLNSAAVLQVIWKLDGVVNPRTIEMAVSYLRMAGEGDQWAHAEIVRAGRRVATVSATAWQDDPDKPFATAHAHVLLI